MNPAVADGYKAVIDIDYHFPLPSNLDFPYSQSELWMVWVFFLVGVGELFPLSPKPL